MMHSLCVVPLKVKNSSRIQCSNDIITTRRLLVTVAAVFELTGKKAQRVKLPSSAVYAEPLFDGI